MSQQDPVLKNKNSVPFIARAIFHLVKLDISQPLP